MNDSVLISGRPLLKSFFFIITETYFLYVYCENMFFYDHFNLCKICLFFFSSREKTNLSHEYFMGNKRKYLLINSVYFYVMTE